MTWPLLPFLVLALLGVVFSLGTHLGTLLGLPLAAVTAWLWWAQLALAPPVLVALGGHAATDGKDPEEGACRGCPSWMKAMTNAITLYAFVDFTVVFLWHMSGFDQRPGTNAPPDQLFSAMCMFFYTKAATILY